MQQELIEMLEEIIPYVEVWHKEDQDVIDKAEKLVEKAKNNNNNAPAVPQGELTLSVEREPDYWSGGHFYEGTKGWINPTKVQGLPIGTKLYTAPAPAQEPVTLTPAEIDRAVLEATGFDGSGTQPMNTHDTRNIGLEVIAALRAKENKL